jgi:hypothetical protein
MEGGGVSYFKTFSRVRQFTCKVRGFEPEDVGILTYSAASAGKARYMCLRAAHDAGYTSVKFSDISVSANAEPKSSEPTPEAKAEACPGPLDCLGCDECKGSAR